MKAFVKLGTFLGDFLQLTEKMENLVAVDDSRMELFSGQITKAVQQNPWFTEGSIRYALSAWAVALSEKNIRKWLSAYPLVPSRPRTIAIVMAGNIPLVGFHDLLCVLITGNRALIKMSSNDRILLPFLADYLSDADPGMQDAICFAEGPIKHYDAVIATGSDNTARYFEYYFGSKPHIIRKNKNSVAVIDGTETNEEILALGRDIFTYFGLGCRNVSKLFVPESYDFNILFNGLSLYSDLLDHRKYRNNYDYNKAVYLMSGFPFLDNGFLLLKEDEGIGSPIGTLFYEHYTDRGKLEGRLYKEREKLQCVVGKTRSGREVAFGNSQQPSLWDYADGVDTVDFLLKT